MVVILDADKEGFLRSNRSLTQTVGRAARHINGKAIMYADTVTQSMKKTIDETNYRREKQINYNRINKIKPKALNKSLDSALAKNSVVIKKDDIVKQKIENKNIAYLSKSEIEKKIREIRKAMENAAKSLDFIEAAKFRDEIKILQDQL